MKQENLSIWKKHFKTLASVLSWVILVVLIAVAGFLLYVGITTKIFANRNATFVPKFSLYTIISPSMKPNINVYDTIIDVRVDDINEIKVGDVITFISTSSLYQGLTVTHRVIDIVNKDGKIQLKTKGDGNTTPDSAFVNENNILGKVVLRIPQLGRIQFFLADEKGWLLIIVIPALIVLSKYVIKLIRLTKINEKAKKNINESNNDEHRY